MKDLKFIEGNEQFGVEYDWSFIRKEFKKLKIPKNVFNPCTLPIEKAAYFVLMSIRSSGKTTNIILLAAIQHYHYGSVTQYVRQTSEMVQPRNGIGDIMNTINQFGYISKITNGEYDSVVKKSRYIYLAKLDSEGKLEKLDEKPFIFLMSLDSWADYKSNYNAPLGDIIIFDEFIGKVYYPDEFIWFMDLIKTIARNRLSVKIFMLANTINKHSSYFHELEIYDSIGCMKLGNEKLITTSLGTNVFVEMIDNEIQRKLNERQNRLLFGFGNTKLASITGAQTWAMSEYPHVPKYSDMHVLFQKIYIEHNNKLVNIKLCTSGALPLYAICSWAIRTYTDSYIYTLDSIIESNHHFKMGNSRTKMDKILADLFKDNKVFYATNDVGSFVENYFSECAKKC